MSPQAQVPDFIPAEESPDFIPAEQQAAPPQIKSEGFWKTFGKDIASIPAGFAEMVKASDNPGAAAIELGSKIGTEDLTRRLDNRPGWYRGAAGIGTALGINAGGMEEAAERGDPGAVMGHAAAAAAPLAVGEGIRIRNAVRGPVPKAIETVPPVEKTARNITRAVNPAVNEWPGYIDATKAEAGNVVEFAKRSGNPLKTQLDWAKAARGAADEANTYYKEKVLGPVAQERVSVANTGYKGPTQGEGHNVASIGDVNARIGAINDELRSAYAKREAGQTREALASEPELKAEQKALTDLLHKSIADRTGLTPEQVGGLRQRFGRMYSIADQTNAAINQRESSAGKAEEGRRDVPVNTAGVAIELFNKHFRGGPTGIANRRFVNAIDTENASSGRTRPVLSEPTPFPEVNPPQRAARVRTPAWQQQAIAIPQTEGKVGPAIPTVEDELEQARRGASEAPPEKPIKNGVSKEKRASTQLVSEQQESASKRIEERTEEKKNQEKKRKK